MSYSSEESESDTEIVRRNLNNSRRPLFHPSSSPPPPVPVPAHKQRAKPRFLGDDDGPTAPAAASVGGGGLGDDFFDDLDDLPDMPMPRRIDVDAFERERLRNASVADGHASAGKDAGDGGADNDDDGDGEVKLKKRRTVAKMDDERLLGPSGFPKLLQDVKRFRVKGKGHEMKDLKKLMSLYQLWAHQMYPRTNLRDTLHSVERLCRKRRVHHALKGYRDEAKLAARTAAEPEGGDGQAQDDIDNTRFNHGADQGPSVRRPPPHTHTYTHSASDDQDEDIEAALEAEREMQLEVAKSQSRPLTKSVVPSRPQRPAVPDEDIFDQDELEMMAQLEREAGFSSSAKAPQLLTTKEREEDVFDEDEAEMMAFLDEQGSEEVVKGKVGLGRTKGAPRMVVREEEEGFDMDELEAMAAFEEEERERERERQSRTTTNPLSTSALPASPPPPAPAASAERKQASRTDDDFAFDDDDGDDEMFAAIVEPLSTTAPVPEKGIVEDQARPDVTADAEDEFRDDGLEESLLAEMDL
ncbi:Swi3-domain-containing protein [Meredithblackwellia eburnea MCA 4105]